MDQTLGVLDEVAFGELNARGIDRVDLERWDHERSNRQVQKPSSCRRTLQFARMFIMS